MRQLTHGLSIAVVFLAGFLAIQSISADPATARVPKGVTIDHDSPSQKEYAIPLEEGRRTGQSRGITSNNSSSSSGSSGQTPQLFGEGVAPDSEHQRRTHSSNSPSEKSENGHATAKTATHRGNISSTQLASLEAPDTGGDNGFLILIGGAAAVLAFGGLFGVLLHRRKQSHR